MLKQGTRVLVTGGAGFIGSHLVRALTSRGAQVRVLDDLSGGDLQRLSGLGRNMEFLHEDMRRSSSVVRAIEGANAIVHLASVPVEDDPLRSQEINLTGMLNILNAARAADRQVRPHIILCSSGSVFGNQPAFVLHEQLAPQPNRPAGVVALAMEQYGRIYGESYGVPLTTLRLFRTFGPDENIDRFDASIVARFIRAALDGTSPIINGDGQQTRDLVYVDNVVSAILAALSVVHPEPLHVASGEAVAINFLWTLILELSGKRRRAIEPTYVNGPSGEPKHVRPQIQRACKTLDWAPAIRLREGLARTISHYKGVRSQDQNAWFAPRQRPFHVPPRERIEEIAETDLIEEDDTKQVAPIPPPRLVAES